MYKEDFITEEITDEESSYVPVKYRGIRRHNDLVKTRIDKKYWYIRKQTELLWKKPALVQQLIKNGKFVFNNVSYTVESRHSNTYLNMFITYKGYTVYAICCLYDGGSITLTGDCYTKEFSHYPSSRNRRWLKKQSAKAIRRYRPVDEDNIEIPPVAYSNKIYGEYAI